MKRSKRIIRNSEQTTPGNDNISLDEIAKENIVVYPFDAEKFREIQNKYLTLKTDQESLKVRFGFLEHEEAQAARRIENAQRALAIIQEVAKQTQQELEFHISSLVTTAIESVNPEWPEFVVKIVIRRNKTECDLLFREHGVDQRPKDSSGGGVKDITSFALRIAYWSLKKNRKTFILDEPFRNVDPTHHDKTSEMVKMLSDRLGVQIIMVSHQEDINVAADKTFYNTMKGQRSKVEVL